MCHVSIITFMHDSSSRCGVSYFVFAVYDVSNRESFSDVTMWLNEVDVYSTTDKLVKMLVANKIDMVCSSSRFVHVRCFQPLCVYVTCPDTIAARMYEAGQASFGSTVADSVECKCEYELTLWTCRCRAHPDTRTAQPNRVVTTKEGLDFAREKNMLFIECRYVECVTD